MGGTKLTYLGKEITLPTQQRKEKFEEAESADHETGKTTWNAREVQ